MRSLTIAFAVTTAVVLATSFAPTAWSAAGLGVGTLPAPAATSPIEPAACRGPGRSCPPGSHWMCDAYHRHCGCAPC